MTWCEGGGGGRGGSIREDKFDDTATHGIDSAAVDNVDAIPDTNEHKQRQYYPDRSTIRKEV